MQKLEAKVAAQAKTCSVLRTLSEEYLMPLLGDPEIEEKSYEEEEEEDEDEDASETSSATSRTSRLSRASTFPAESSVGSALQREIIETPQGATGFFKKPTSPENQATLSREVKETLPGYERSEFTSQAATP